MSVYPSIFRLSKEMLVTVDPSTAILVIFQWGYYRAKALPKLRTVLRDNMSMLWWRAEQKDEYVVALGVFE